jgi:hypothetical protein
LINEVVLVRCTLKQGALTYAFWWSSEQEKLGGAGFQEMSFGDFTR